MIRMNYRKLFQLLLLFLFPENGKSLDLHPAAVIPGIHIGYIFGAGISAGAELNYTPFVFKSGLGQTATGAYASLTYFHSKGELYTATWYHTYSAGALALADNRFMFKGGVCKSVLRWGRENMNKTKSKRITPDIDLSYSPTQHGEFIGYRVYFPGNACFGLDIDVAHMIYGAYRYNADPTLFSTTRE